MHPGTVNSGQAHDGARQFAFECALVIDVLLKLGDAEFLVFHQLKTHHRAFWQALRSQFQAGVMDFLGRNRDGVLFFVIAVGHIHLVKCIDDVAAVHIIDTREQHAVVGLSVPQHQRGDQGHDDRNGGQQGHPVALGQVLQALEYPVDRIVPGAVCCETCRRCARHLCGR
jgi:hypothetical protein